MQHFPIYLNTAGHRVVLAGGGEAALAKLRLLLKTEARLTVFTPDAAPEIRDWAAQGKLPHLRALMDEGAWSPLESTIPPTSTRSARHSSNPACAAGRSPRTCRQPSKSALEIVRCSS